MKNDPNKVLKNYPKLINNIFDIQKDYQVFILDQWGVLHNGYTVYPNIIETLTKLKQSGKILIVLSNSARIAEVNQKRMQAKGFDPKLFDAVISSGEAFKQHILQKDFKLKNTKAFCFNLDDALEDWQKLGLTFTADIKKAGWVLLNSVTLDFDFDQGWNILKQALPLNLPLYCINPDVLIVSLHNKTYFGPGYLAQKYLNSGGKVLFFGKPHSYVYELCKKIIPKSDFKKVLCVGDSLEHDIKGAYDNGFDSLFIGSGIFYQHLKDPTSLELNLKKLIAEYNISPTFYAFRLA